jgi:hypothetical protein
MEFTESQIKGVNRDWNKLAGETVRVEVIKRTFYAFGTELASLRLLKAHRNYPQADSGYSENLKTFYFRLETEA